MNAAFPSAVSLRRAATAAVLFAAACVSADIRPGVEVPEDRDSLFSVSYGAVMSLSGRVDETFRAYYKATGQDNKQSLAESWKLDDFGFDAPWSAFGFHFEHIWRWASLRMDLSLFDVDAKARAKRDYYLGLEDDISYGGRKYGHLKIPKGSSFASEYSGGLGSLELAVTPFTLAFDESLRLVPELDLGLMAVAGEWKIDAGKARGVATYQNPPVDFVVGGSSSSILGAGAPFLGAGAELRVGQDDYVQWVTRGKGGFFSYSGSTKPFTNSSHRKKDLDVDLFTLEIDTSVILPMDERTCFLVGVKAQWLSLDGSIKSKARDAASIIAARERFDKKVDIDVAFVQAYAGITF